jgi:hypothetical protein
MPGHRKPALAAKSVGGLKYFKRLQPLFERLHDLGTDHDPAGNRQLHFDHYAALILLSFFNPGLTSLRAIQKASELDKVQRKLGVPRTSLGALSAAARVFDPEPLRAIIAELAAEALPLESGREAEVLRGLTAVDGSLLPALPKMAWALWVDDTHRAAKLHLHFDVFKGVPGRATSRRSGRSRCCAMTSVGEPVNRSCWPTSGSWTSRRRRTRKNPETTRREFLGPIGVAFDSAR